MHSKSELRRQAVGNPEALVKRIAELEAALKPFAEAFDQFAKNESCTRVLSLGQLGRLAAMWLDAVLSNVFTAC